MASLPTTNCKYRFNLVMAHIPWYINSRPYSFEGGGDIIYKSGRKNDNPLPEGEEVTVVAQAPSYFKKKRGTSV